MLCVWVGRVGAAQNASVSLINSAVTLEGARGSLARLSGAGLSLTGQAPADFISDWDGRSHSFTSNFTVPQIQHATIQRC